jgi:N-methylhydantoinase A
MTAGGGMTTIETAARIPDPAGRIRPRRAARSSPRNGARPRRSTGAFLRHGRHHGQALPHRRCPPADRARFEIARAARFLKGSGMPVRIPVIEMIEIGAGGGSIAGHVDRMGRIRVGPESAGADPGPVAFGKGGTTATVTDADVTLGYIDPARFAEGRLSIDRPRRYGRAGRGRGPLGLDAAATAFGVSEVVDESMAGAGRMHAVESGKDLSQRLMIAFGGNGPLHATRVARRAGVSPHRHPARSRRRLRRGVPACAGVLRDRAFPLRHARRARRRRG